jgi:hypothetical protein
LLLYLIGASRAAARQAEGEARGEPVGNDGTAVRRAVHSFALWGSVVVHGRARDDQGAQKHRRNKKNLTDHLRACCCDPFDVSTFWSEAELPRA